MSEAASSPAPDYHSVLYRLLSWQSPRTTITTYGTIVTLIVAGRYLPLLGWGFKLLYLSLAVAVSLEIVGRIVLSRGIASSSRPRKYYTIPKDTLEGLVEDAEQLVDFFLIEFQRIIFVEKFCLSITAFFVSLAAYWLIKFVPLWGLLLIGTTFAFFGPLFYLTYKDIIDGQVEDIQAIVNAQTAHVKTVVVEKTTQVNKGVKDYFSSHRARSQEFVASRSPSKSPSIKPEEPAAQPAN